MEPGESLHDVKGSGSRAVANVLTWNINGLRKVAADHGGLEVLLNQFHADVVCFQEIKITRAGLVEHDLARAQGYHCFFSHCKVPRKPSYSGVATFVRSGSGLRTLASTSSLSDTRFFGALTHHGKGVSSGRLGEIDAEGRVLVTDHGHFVLFNIYGPCISSGDDDERTEERRVFKRDFLAMLEARILGVRDRGQHVILVGDLNSCVSQLDHGFTMTDKDFYSSPWSKWIRGLLGLDSTHPPRLLDCFRHRHPDRKNAFTCWNTQTGARENNYGTRIDYIIADAVLVKKALQTCDIMPEFLGSDHCPVKAKFALPVVASQGRGRLTSDAAARSSMGEGTDGDGDGDGDDVGVALGRRLLKEWPEHPPECSCFYVELKGKQEKLVKFLVVGASAFKKAELNGVHVEERVKVQLGSARERTQENGGKRTRQSKLMFPTIPTAESKAKVARGSCSSSTSGSCWGGSNMRKATASNLSEDSTTSLRLSDKKDGMLLRGSVSTRSTLSGSAREDHGEFRDGTERRLELACGGGKASHGHASHGGSSKGVEVVDAADKQEEGRRLPPARCANGGGGDDEGGSAEAWKALFNRKKSTPLCEHGEPSIQRTVIKQGANHNRRFYTCARSAGNWPTDRNARCNFFQWRLDGVRGYKDRPSQGEDSRKLRRTA